MRRRLAVLALVALLAPLAACGTGPRPGTISVMTWNVETVAHDPREWVPVVAAERPDVLALQEICVREAVELADLLRREGLDYAVVPGPIRPPTPGEAHAPVNAALGPVCDTPPDDVQFGLAVLARVPIGASRVTTYPPDHRDEQRGALALRTASGVAVVDTHIGLAGVQAGQLRHLADVVPDGRVVVLGDLNVPTGAPELAPLSRSLVDIDPSDRAIDHVFVRGLVAVGEPRTPPVISSDHRPLVVDLRVAE